MSVYFDDEFCPTWLRPQRIHTIEPRNGSSDEYVRAVAEYISFEAEFCTQLAELVKEVNVPELPPKLEALVAQQMQILLAFQRHYAALLNTIAFYGGGKPRTTESLLQSVSCCDLTKLDIPRILDECFDSPRTFPTKTNILSLYLKQTYINTLKQSGPKEVYLQVSKITTHIINHISSYPAIFKHLNSLVDKHARQVPVTIKHDIHVALIRINRYLDNLHAKLLISAGKPLKNGSSSISRFDAIASEALSQGPTPPAGSIDSAHDFKAQGLRALDHETSIKRKRTRPRGPRHPPDRSMIKVISNYGNNLQQKCKALETFRQSIENHQASIAKFHQHQLDFCAKWEMHMDAPGMAADGPTDATPPSPSPYIKSAWWSFHQKMRSHDRDVQKAITELEQRVLQPLQNLTQACGAAAKRVWLYHRLLEGAEAELINHELKIAAAEWSKEVPQLLQYIDEAVSLLARVTDEVTTSWTIKIIGRERREQYLAQVEKKSHHPLNGCKHADIVAFYQTQFDMSMQ